MPPKQDSDGVDIYGYIGLGESLWKPSSNRLAVIETTVERDVWQRD